MSEETRQRKLARARKKLKEFQKRRVAAPSGGAKDTKNIKNGGSPKTTTLGGCTPPEVHKDRTAPLKETGIDGTISKSGSFQAPPESEDEDTDSSNSVHSLSIDESLISVEKETQNYDTNGINSTNDENQSLSSTESLRQISQQLTGLVSQSYTKTKDITSTDTENLKSSFTNTKDLTSTAVEDLESSSVTTKDVTSPNIKDLELPLTNTKDITPAYVEDLEEKQNEDLEKLRENDKKEFETKFAKEKGCLRHQLEVQIQTIGILINEKSDLRSALFHTQNAVKAKTGELEGFAVHLKASQQRIEQLEHRLSTVTKEKNSLTKCKKELLKERDDLLVQVLKHSSTNETLIEKNVQLQKELETVQKDLKILREELDAPACKIQQDSAEQFSLEPTDDENNALLKDQVEQLSKEVQSLKGEKELSLAKIQELEAQLTVLKEEEAVHPPDNPPVRPLKNEEQLHAELDNLRKQLCEQRKDYQMMILQYQSREQRLRELEIIEEQWREHVSLKPAILETLENNQATIRSVLSQNKDLKDQLKELQDSFIRLTNDKLELTDMLQTEQHTRKELTKKIDELQKNLQELKTMKRLMTAEEKNQQLEAQMRDLVTPREGEDVLVRDEDKDVAQSVLNSQDALVVGAEKKQAQHEGQGADVEVRDTPNAEPSASELRVLQGAMEKLQGHFVDVTKEKLEYLEHSCTQLPGQSATIGNCAALYLDDRALLKEHHQAKEEGIGQVAQDQDVEVKASEAALKLMTKDDEGEQNPLLQSETAAAPHAAPETAAPRVELTSKVNQGEASSFDAPILKMAGQIIQFLLWNTEEDSMCEQTDEGGCVPLFYRTNPKGSPLKVILV